jgi:hypothetical protein
MALVVLAMAVLLFTRLGHYALWDDETMVGLIAKGIMRTGDTSVLLDHGNLLAYRGGLVVHNYCDRSTPPLPAYLTAGSFSLFGLNAWTARMPFALLGLATVALMMFEVRRQDWTTLAVFALGLLGNVSLILYFRQCRYYGPGIFFCVAIVWLYGKAKPSSRNLLVLAGLSVLLFASNYLTYLGLYLCLGVDYLIWKRKDWPPTWRSGLLLFGPQVIPNGAIAYIWNPLQTHFGDYEAMNSLGDRLTLFFWYWRDMNACEFFALPMLLLALGVGLFQRRLWLVRGCLALVIYIAVVTFTSPQPVHLTSVADIRYASAIIPLGIALEAGAICALLGRRPALAIGAALLVFGTNLLNGGPFLDGGFRSTIVSYVGELIHPPAEPYTPTADWINEHVPEGGSVWVLPDYATYPLMFAAPGALYAWQLPWPPRADFDNLPPIHFIGQQPPDYIVAFGPSVSQMVQTIQNWNRDDVSYRQVATIPVFWKDLYRPELFWRTFRPLPNFDLRSQAIYIFQRIKPSPAVAPESK